MKDELIKLMNENKRVRLTCIFGKSEPIFYTCRIKRVGEDFIVIEDKYGNEVVLDLDTIAKVEVEKDDNKNR
ncbi:MAG: hypothetical protein QXG39_00065 [Candidatus Aenigmatarchaeota archaeon]